MGEVAITNRNYQDFWWRFFRGALPVTFLALSIDGSVAVNGDLVSVYVIALAIALIKPFPIKTAVNQENRTPFDLKSDSLAGLFLITTFTIISTGYYYNEFKFKYFHPSSIKYFSVATLFGLLIGSFVITFMDFLKFRKAKSGQNV